MPISKGFDREASYRFSQWLSETQRHGQSGFGPLSKAQNTLLSRFWVALENTRLPCFSACILPLALVRTRSRRTGKVNGAGCLRLYLPCLFFSTPHSFQPSRSCLRSTCMSPSSQASTSNHLNFTKQGIPTSTIAWTHCSHPSYNRISLH